MARSVTQDISPRLPNFLVVGTAKAGTTSLEAYLLQHPDIDIPRKETFYFNAPEFKNSHLPYPSQRPNTDIIKSFESYSALYQNSRTKRVGEVGTGYLYHHQVSIPRIIKTLGRDLPIFILLRNPVERAYSAYMHFKKDCFESVSFAEALEMERYRKEQNWDFMWHYKSLGHYFQQVRAFKEHFNQVHVLFFDDLKRHPQQVMNRIFEALEVDAVKRPFEQVKNPSGEAVFPVFQKLITHENTVKKVLRPLVRIALSEKNRAYLRKYLKAKNLKSSDKPPEEVMRELFSDYRTDILRLSDLLQTDLNHWKYG